MTRSRPLAILALFVSLPLAATTITVDESCTLVDAIAAANDDAAVGGCPAGSGPDEIHLTADVSLSEINNNLFGATALPVVVSEIDLVGHGHTIERAKGAPAMRLLYVDESGDLKLYSVAIARGSGSFLGSGVASDGAFAMVNTTIAGSGVYAASGQLLNSHVRGGFLFLSGSRDKPSLVRDSVLSGSHYPHHLWEVATLSHSTVYGNVGDALVVNGSNYYVAGDTAVANSTVAGNTATGARFDSNAAISVNPAAKDIAATLSNTTIARNSLATPFDSGVYLGYYGGSLSVRNTISGENGAGSDCELVNTFGLVNGGGNFDSDGTCGASNAVTGLDTELRDHGGTTPTLALLEGSSAIGGGVACAGQVDQRGVPRASEACDSGAFEARGLAVELSTDGFCPGLITVVGSGGTPGGEIVVGRATDYGPTLVRRGACAGTPIGLGEPSAFARATVGPDGTFSVQATSTLEECSHLLQAVDLATCEISDVATVGRPPQPPPCTQPARCGLVRLRLHGARGEVPQIADEYLVGDWDGDGCDNVATRRGSTILYETRFDGLAELRQDYGGGDNEDQYLVGDWNGDGCDDIAVRRGDLLLMDTDFDGIHDLTATFGPGGDADEYLVGDLDGSGSEAVVYRDGNTLEWDLAPWDGNADGTTAFGRGDNEDQYLLGHWSDDGTSQQTLAVRRGNQILMNFDLDGTHDFTQTYGLGDLEDEYLVGDWDGDGRDNLAVRRGGKIEMDTDFDDHPDFTMTFGEGTEE